MKLNSFRIGLLLGAAALLMAWVVVQQRVRARQRRYVNQWVHERSRMDSNATREQNEARIRAALIREEKTVIPLLLEDIQRAEPYDEVIWRWLSSKGLGRYLQWLRRNETASPYRIEAIKALRLMGTNGLSALPTLWQHFDRSTAGIYGAEINETALTLAVLAGHLPETASRLGQLTNDRHAELQLTGWILTAALIPSNSVAHEEIRWRLTPAEETPIPALDTSLVLGELGASGASVAPMVRAAIAKSYLSWPLFGLARVAHALWRADGNPDFALQSVHRAWQEFSRQLQPDEQPADAGPITDISRSTIYQMAKELGSIPEVAKEMRPLLMSMPTSDPEREVALKCLEPVGRGGEQPAVGATKN